MKDRTLYFYGTQKAYDKSEKVDKGLYFITDSERLYKGNNLISANNVKVVTEMPSINDSIEGVLYLHKTPSSITLNIADKDNSKYITLASSDIVTSENVVEFNNKIIDSENNDILNLKISNFDTESISKSISLANASDEKLVTEKAIVDAYSDVLSSVSSKIESDETVITFTSKNGNSNSIKVPIGNSIKSGVYDYTKSVLVITMTNGDVVEVPLSFTYPTWESI